MSGTRSAPGISGRWRGVSSTLFDFAVVTRRGFGCRLGLGRRGWCRGCSLSLSLRLGGGRLGRGLLGGGLLGDRRLGYWLGRGLLGGGLFGDRRLGYWLGRGLLGGGLLGDGLFGDAALQAAGSSATGSGRRLLSRLGLRLAVDLRLDGCVGLGGRLLLVWALLVLGVLGLGHF